MYGTYCSHETFQRIYKSSMILCFELFSLTPKVLGFGKQKDGRIFNWLIFQEHRLR